MATATATSVQVIDGHEHDGDEAKTHTVYAVAVTTPVRLDQLDAEITEAMNWRKQAGLSADGDITAPTEEHPVLLTVQRADEIDESVFLATVQAHTPDPAWQATDPEQPPTFADAKARALAEEPLSTTDLEVLVRGLLSNAT